MPDARTLGRYNSAPFIFGQRQAGNLFSGLFPMRPNLNMASALRYGPQKPAPSAQISPPNTVPATTQGIQALAEKAGSRQDAAPSNWLERAVSHLLKSQKCADAGATSSAPTGVATSSPTQKGKATHTQHGIMTGIGSAPNQQATPMNPATQQMPGAQGQPGFQGQPSPWAASSALLAGGAAAAKPPEVGAYGVVRPGWKNLKPQTAPLGTAAPKAAAAAPIGNPAQLPPVPGLTANQPPPPGPGVNAAPSPPPAAPGTSLLAPPGVGPGGAPLTQPPMPPMAEPPPVPLPANPRLLPPQPKTSDQALAQAVSLRAQEAGTQPVSSSIDELQNDE